MKRRNLCWLFLIVLVSAIGISLLPPLPGLYRGTYVGEYEMVGFRPCGYNELWWVVIDVSALSQYSRQLAPYTDAAAGGAIYIEWRGLPGWRGSYGPLGRYVRQFTVSEVLTVTDQPFPGCD